MKSKCFTFVLFFAIGCSMEKYVKGTKVSYFLENIEVVWPELAGIQGRIALNSAKLGFEKARTF